MQKLTSYTSLVIYLWSISQFYLLISAASTIYNKDIHSEESIQQRAGTWGSDPVWKVLFAEV